MNKRPLSIALLLFLVLAVCLAVLPTTAEAAAAPIQVTPSVTAAYPGESITVTVSVAGSTNFTSVGFIPKVNSSVYEITDRKMLSGINNAPLKAFDAQGGVAAFDTAAAHTGDYFRYTLKIKSTAPAGSYALVDSAVVMNGTSMVDIAVPSTKILVAATNITQTISGTSLKWNLNKGVLTITGSGAIPSYSATGAPWYAYRDLIKTVVMDPGVTKVGANAFVSCKKLTKLTFKGSQEQWESITVSSGNDPLKKADPVFNGFYTKNNNTYYGNNGTNVTGWKTVSGKTHYFKVGTGGTMAKGWTTIGGLKYYFKQADGAMVTGVVTIGGVPNEFTSEGVWVREVPAPKITKQPASAKVAVNQTVSTTVTATGESLTYTWYVQNPGTTSWVKSSVTKNVYSYLMEAAKNGRKVYCVVSDPYGQSVKSNIATLSMAAAPKITKQPVSTKAALNKTVTVSFTASGEGLTYKWYYKEAGAKAFTYTSSFTTNSYSVPMTAARNGRQIYCVVTDKYGQTVKTNTATISVAAVPKITKQPVSTKAAINKSLTVSFTASGEGLTYKWYYKDAGASTFTYTSSFTTNAYTTTMTAARNGRQIYCVVTDKYGQTVKTNTVTISMAVAPKITKQPVSTKAANNKSLTVSFTASGEGLTYKWYYKNQGASAFTYTSTFKSNSYTTTMDATRNGRQIYCVVTDKYGQTVKTNTVTISMAAAPKITKQPVSTKAALNKTVTVSFTASGEGLTYKWYYKEAGASAFTYTSSFTTNSYSVSMTAARNGRQIYCVVTDKYGQTVKTNTATISVAAVPKITKQPVSTKAANNKSVAVSLTATGEGLSYKWYYKDAGASAFTYTSSFTTNSYTTTMTTARSGRQLYCVVTDKYGQTVKSNTVTISKAAAPKITKQPVSVTTANGKSLTVSFTASGEGLSYKWYYMNAGASTFTYTSTFKSNSYTTTMDATRNGRQLYCVVTDKFGQTAKTNTVTIGIAAEPKITKQPVSVAVANGATARVSVTATGEGLTYTWYVMDPGIYRWTESSNKTNTYSVAMNAAKNGRKVYCVVTDAFDRTVESNMVILSMK